MVSLTKNMYTCKCDRILQDVTAGVTTDGNVKKELEFIENSFVGLNICI